MDMEMIVDSLRDEIEALIIKARDLRDLAERFPLKSDHYIGEAEKVENEIRNIQTALS